MKGKSGKIIAIISSVVFLLWIITRMTNVFLFSRTMTSSGYPTINSGEIIYGSSLIKPERLDFIVVKTIHPEFGNSNIMSRLVGIENDKIELRNGVLFVNDVNTDQGLSLAHGYKIDINELNNIKETEKLSEEFFFMISEDSAICFLNDKIAEQKKLTSKRWILAKNNTNERIANSYPQNWNKDNFGPFIVPKDHFFILGDNRDNSNDSRFIGYIKKSDFVATIFNK
jgi:signal peptidase I